MSFQYGTLQDSPQLYNGLRYSDEEKGAKTIPKDIGPEVLQLLRKYYTEVCLKGPPSSDGSRTSAPARSEASTGTSITNNTPTFSVDNRPVKPEPARRPLDSVTRARKALLRKLGACQEDCRRRKVKCQLWHHSLRDLLEIEHKPGDEEIIEWGMKFDTDSQTPVATTPVLARVSTFDMIEDRGEVIDQATSAFDLPPGTPMPYAPVIEETDASLLPPGRVSPRSVPHGDTPATAAQQSYRYSTAMISRPLHLGTRDDTFTPTHYRCQFPTCAEVLPMQALIAHFEIDHFHFERLNRPLRMVCPICDSFYAFASEQCARCPAPSLVEKLYGRYLPGTLTPAMPPGTGAIHSGPSEYRSYGVQGPNWTLFQGPSSYPPSGALDNYNNPYGSSPNFGGSCWYSTAKSALAHLKRSFLSLPTLPLYLFRSLVRRRYYIAALVIAATVSLVLSYKKHNWIVSNLVQLTHGVLVVSPSNLPLIGVIFASVAFGLHRIVVDAYHANGIRRGRWLSRCALNMFNVACGRQRAELLEREPSQPRP